MSDYRVGATFGGSWRCDPGHADDYAADQGVDICHQFHLGAEYAG